MNILITGGGTIEKIDQMRSITNQSTGRTAIKLAESLLPKASITLLLAQNISYQNSAINILNFTNVSSLKKIFLSLKNTPYDLVIHAAAVSDYEIDEITDNGKKLNHSKIPSGLSRLTLKLKPTQKLINSLKDIWPKAKLAGFKLTSDISDEQIEISIKKVMKDANLDYIIHNDIMIRRSGLDQFNFYNKQFKLTQIQGLENLALNLYNNLINNHGINL